MSEPLVATVGGLEVARVVCPRDLGGRDWILGVMAVQLDGGEARLRANLTGWRDAQVVPLHPGAVHIAYGGGVVPPLEPPPPGLSVYRDGELVATTSYAAGRAFGHVFCRYLRSGDDEAGFDLTPFLDLPEGVKYRRIVSETLRPGQVVSYVFTDPQPTRPAP